MTHPSQEGVVRRGPLVIDAEGPRWSPPYDTEALVSQFQFSPDFGVVMVEGNWGILEFTTDEPDGQVFNALRFGGTTDAGHMMFREDVWATIRGDIDSVEETVPNLDGRRWRTMHVSFPRPTKTDEERVAAEVLYLERHARREQLMRRENLRKILADSTAAATLRKFLNDEQRASLTKGYFDVTGSAGGRYRIYTDHYSGNVRWLKPKPDRRFKTGVRYVEAAQFCGHSELKYKIPNSDHHLAQMLELVTHEGLWVQTAVRQIGEYPPAYWADLPRMLAEHWAYAEQELRERHAGKDSFDLLYGNGALEVSAHLWGR